VSLKRINTVNSESPGNPVSSGKFRRASESTTASKQASCRFTDRQFRGKLAVHCRKLTFFQYGVDSLQHDTHGHRAHSFHRLPHRGEGRSVQTTGSNVVKSDDRTLFRHT